MSYAFHPSRRPTLGIEEEYQICDPETGALVPRVDDLLRRADADLRAFLSYDLIQGLIETNTDVSANVDEGIADLIAKRRRIQALAEAAGCTLGITGSHPFADPRQTAFVDTPGYRWVRSQLRYVASRNITFGMHVHVGVDDAERAVYVANCMRRWIGALIALAANSPFIDGVDSGWDSARSVAFGAFPRSGVPPHLRSFAHYEAIMDGLAASGAIEKPRHIWWNVRVHPEYGTVEVRACDVQMSLRRTAAIVALCQALVVAYGERHRRGEAEPRLERAFLEDARFKGMRFGMQARVPDAETGAPVSTRQQLRQMLDMAGEAAVTLGTERHLEVVRAMIGKGNGACYQRRVAEELGGDLIQVQRRLLSEAREQILRPDSETS